MNVINVIGLFTFLVTCKLPSYYSNSVTIKFDGNIDTEKKRDLMRVNFDLIRHISSEDIKKIEDKKHGISIYREDYIGNSKRMDVFITDTDKNERRSVSVNADGRQNKWNPKESNRENSANKKKPKTILKSPKEDHPLTEFIIKAYRKSNGFLELLKVNVKNNKFILKISRVTAKFKQLFKSIVKEIVKSDDLKKILRHLVAICVNFLRSIRYVIARTKLNIFSTKSKKQSLMKVIKDDINTVTRIACTDFNICRSRSTLMLFIADYLEEMRKYDVISINMIATVFLDRLDRLPLHSYMEAATLRKLRALLRRGYDDFYYLRVKINLLLDMIRNIYSVPKKERDFKFKNESKNYQTLVKVFGFIDGSFPMGKGNMLNWERTQLYLSDWYQFGRKSEKDLDDIFKYFFDFIEKQMKNWEGYARFFKSKSKELINNFD